jgi:hypothetical protein
MFIPIFLLSFIKGIQDSELAPYIPYTQDTSAFHTQWPITLPASISICPITVPVACKLEELNTQCCPTNTVCATFFNAFSQQVILCCPASQ